MLRLCVHTYTSMEAPESTRVRLKIAQMLGSEISCKLLLPPGRCRTDIVPVGATVNVGDLQSP